MTNEKHLNIICFDVPYPPDYGGVIDVYYKIKALQDIGIKIHCHTFLYKDRKKSEKLEGICEKTFYYKRNRYKNPFIGELPYIVKTRKSEDLIRNLLENDYPILFEGLHTCFYLKDKKLANRKKIVRMHNIEDVYYKHLAKIEKNPFKKSFFNTESKKLKKFSEILKHSDFIAAISKEDNKYFNVKFKNKSFCLPAFHPFNEINIIEKTENFALYHGNLSVGENVESAMFLIKNIFNKINKKLIIAGKNPNKELVEIIQNKKNIKLISNPDDKILQNLIKLAKINILPTFQNTGIKLKLINVLFNGKFVIVNKKMVENTKLSELCIVTGTKKDMINAIIQYFEKDFDKKQVNKRKELLLKNFSNNKNAELFIKMIDL